MPTAKADHDTSAPTAQARPSSCWLVPAAAAPDKACQPMHSAPSAHSSIEGSMRRKGTAPWSRLPISVTATGRKPITSDVIAMPPCCTAVDSST
ncbi:hypothetical protein D3C71_1763530 [compost metagenome]